MKKILFIMRTLDGGGAEKVLINILNNINYKKYNVTLLLINKQGIYMKDINKNVKIEFIYDPKKFSSRIMQSLYYRITMFLYYKTPKFMCKLLINNKYDVEIAFLEDEVTSFLSKNSNKKSKKIAWVHTDLKKYDIEKREKMRIDYMNFDKVICVSRETKTIFNELFSEYKDKSQVIYNIIDSKKIFSLAKKGIEYKFKESTLIGVGRLVKEKRFDLLIKAHKMLIDEGIENELIILGNGYEEVSLKNLIKELKLEKSVKMLGFIENPYPYIAKSDILIITSDYEGCPLVLSEALTLGKPIISTKCNGPNELLNHGEYGYMVDRDNIVQLKNSIKELLLDHEKRSLYKNKSLERANMLIENNIMNEIYSLLDS